MDKANINNVIKELRSKWNVIDKNRTFHSEENVLVHCLQTMFNIKKVTCNPVLILAAALHDIGKNDNKAHYHAIAGTEFLKKNCVTNSELLFLIEQHMRFHKFINGEMKKPYKVIEIANSNMLKKQVLLHRSDCMSRESNHLVYYDFDTRESLIAEIETLLLYIG